jgi:hypothetical protein
MLFESVYQGGPSVEVFGTSGSNPLEKWKVSGAVRKVYDKQVRGFILSCEGGPAIRMQLPKDDRRSLGLVQPFVVLQLFLAEDKAFSFAMQVSDAAHARHRLLFSTSAREQASTPLHARIPLGGLPRGVWLNLVLDLAGLVAHSFGAKFARLDSLTLGSSCKLRRICTLRDAPVLPPNNDGFDTDLNGLAPKGFELPPGVPAVTHSFTVEDILAAAPCESTRSGTRHGTEHATSHAGGSPLTSPSGLTPQTGQAARGATPGSFCGPSAFAVPNRLHPPLQMQHVRNGSAQDSLRSGSAQDGLRNGSAHDVLTRNHTSPATTRRPAALTGGFNNASSASPGGSSSSSIAAPPPGQLPLSRRSNHPSESRGGSEASNGLQTSQAHPRRHTRRDTPPCSACYDRPSESHASHEATNGLPAAHPRRHTRRDGAAARQPATACSCDARRPGAASLDVPTRPQLEVGAEAAIGIAVGAANRQTGPSTSSISNNSSLQLRRQYSELQLRRQRIRQLEDSFERQYGDAVCTDHATGAHSSESAQSPAVAQPQAIATAEESEFKMSPRGQLNGGVGREVDGLASRSRLDAVEVPPRAAWAGHEARPPKGYERVEATLSPPSLPPPPSGSHRGLERRRASLAALKPEQLSSSAASSAAPIQPTCAAVPQCGRRPSANNFLPTPAATIPPPCAAVPLAHCGRRPSGSNLLPSLRIDIANGDESRPDARASAEPRSATGGPSSGSTPPLAFSPDGSSLTRAGVALGAFGNRPQVPAILSVVNVNHKPDQHLSLDTLLPAWVRPSLAPPPPSLPLIDPLSPPLPDPSHPSMRKQRKSFCSLPLTPSHPPHPPRTLLPPPPSLTPDHLVPFPSRSLYAQTAEELPPQPGRHCGQRWALLCCSGLSDPSSLPPY